MSALQWAKYARQAQLAGEHELARHTYELAIGAGASAVDVWLGYAMALAETNHGEAALAAFAKSVDQDAQREDAWCLLGELALDLKRYGLAADAFAHCHHIDPKAERPHGARAKALARKAYKALLSEDGTQQPDSHSTVKRRL